MREWKKGRSGGKIEPRERWAEVEACKILGWWIDELDRSRDPRSCDLGVTFWDKIIQTIDQTGAIQSAIKSVIKAI